MRWFGVGLGGAGGAIMDATYEVFSSRSPEGLIGAVVFNTAESDRAKLRHLKESFYLFGEFGGAGVGARWKDSMRAMGSPEAKEMVRSVLERRGISGATGVLLSTALGGGTGSGSTPLVARYVREILGGESSVQPIVSVGVLPFRYPRESMRFAYNSAVSLSNLLSPTDSVFLLDNDVVWNRVVSDEPNLSDEEALQRINRLAGLFLRAISVASSNPMMGGFKTTLDSQDLRSMVRFFEASICVPCYASVRVEAVEGSLEFLMELALGEGCFAEVEPKTALKAAFVIRGPERYLNVNSLFEAKRVLAERIAGIDVREGLAAAPEDEKRFEISVLLVEPRVPRIDEILEQAELYYNVHEDELTKMEDTPRDEFEGYLERLRSHLEKAEESRRGLEAGSG